jgi:ATP-dependent Clp protease ATP-binding subunit ClpA
VVDKFVLQLEAQLSDRNVTFSLTNDSREWLAKKGYDPQFGARPLSRVIQEHIKKPLSDELLFGKLKKGGHVTVSLKDDKLAFDIESEPPRPKKGGPGGNEGDSKGDGGSKRKVPEKVK